MVAKLNNTYRCVDNVKAKVDSAHQALLTSRLTFGRRSIQPYTAEPYRFLDCCLRHAGISWRPHFGDEWPMKIFLMKCTKTEICKPLNLILKQFLQSISGLRSPFVGWLENKCILKVCRKQQQHSPNISKGGCGCGLGGRERRRRSR